MAEEIANEEDQESMVKESASSSEGQYNLILLKEHGKSSRSRALRLKPNDIVVAINGIEFNGDIQEFVDRLATEDVDEWLLTIYRDSFSTRLSWAGFILSLNFLWL